jgi:hypothetical protein
MKYLLRISFMKKFILISLFLSLVSNGCNYKKENQNQSKEDTKINVVYSTLDVGSIKPNGWLLDWANSAGKGITGHLDERATVFEKGWSGESFEARGVREEGTGWPLEQSAYWLDGLVRLAYILNDSTLINKAKNRLDPIVDGVLNGGPSFIHWRPKEQLNEEFDNWAHSHIGRALVAYYSATKDPRILEALVKVYNDYTFPELVSSSFHDVNGFVNIDPIIETYIFSNDAGVLLKALSLSETQGFKDLIIDWNKGSLEVGHGVIFYENIRVPAILSILIHDNQLLSATLKALEWAEKDHLLPVGLVSSEEYLAGIGSTRNIETCNIAAGAHALNWLLRITGKSDYADQIEQIFFNAGPVPISRDFQTMCYYQSHNRISTEFPQDRPSNPSGGNSFKFTEIGHEVICCVGNSNRIIPNFIMNMWMKTEDNGLAAVLYGPSSLSTTVNGTPVKIQSSTNYPFEENIQMLVLTKKKNNFPLHLRLPSWCENPLIKINNKKVNTTINGKGFVVIQRTWESGDKIELLFPMKVKVIHGRETKYAEIDYFKKKENARRIAKSDAEVNNPYSTVFYGPLIFALPIDDNGPNSSNSLAPYNFALNINSEKTNEIVEIEKHEIKRPWSWQLENAPIKITVPAIQFDWKYSELQPLPPKPIFEGKDTTIVLIPYNLTKFRVSMFPIAASSLNR